MQKIKMKHLPLIIVAAITLWSCSTTSTVTSSNLTAAVSAALPAIPATSSAATYVYLEESIPSVTVRAQTKATIVAIATAAQKYAGTGSAGDLQTFLTASVPASTNVYQAAAINFFIAEYQIFQPIVMNGSTINMQLAAEVINAVASGALAGAALAQ